MARHLRLEFPGAIYHVTSRMIGDWQAERTYLFRDDADRSRFLAQLEDRVEQHTIRLYLFVLMANHFHLVFQTPEGNCSKFMQALNTAYTVYFNRRHGRHGHLLDGRFKAKLVEGDKYLLALSRYVHLNPVQVCSLKSKPVEERIQVLRSYRWSSYPGYIHRRKALDFVQYGPLLSAMQGWKADGPRRYREFVEAGLAHTDADFEAVRTCSPRCIGGDEFCSWVEGLYQERLETIGRREDASFRHVGEALPPEEVLSILGEIFQVDREAFTRRRHDSPLRGVAARCLIGSAGLSQREVADLLGIGSGAAVCNQLHRLPDKLAQDPHLRSRLTEAEEQLKQAKRSPETGMATVQCIVKG